MFGITNAAEALQVLKTATWIATGVCGLCALGAAFILVGDFKNSSKGQKVKDFLTLMVPILLIGLFWMMYFNWGLPIAAMFN